MRGSDANSEFLASPALPLVRLNLILPFIRRLDRQRVDTNAVLTANGLARETVLDSNVFVPVIVVHRFLEDAAVAAGNRHFGSEVGESLDLSRWAPFVDAVSHAITVMEFLVRFIRGAQGDASSAHHVLEVGAFHTSFREVRTSEAELAPAQNDAFTAAFVLGLLRRGAGSAWRAEAVRLKVCDPGALPNGYLGVHVVAGDRMGMSARFPSDWLLQPLDREALVEPAGNEPGSDRLDPPVGFRDALRQTLSPHLGETHLNVDTVARLTGMSRQSLQRQLRVSGTTVSDELRELRLSRARAALIDSDRRIADIALSLGFSNPTSFTRAFSTWTGESPRAFRKRHRTP